MRWRLWLSSLLAAPPTHAPNAVAISNTGYFVNNNISFALLKEKVHMESEKNKLEHNNMFSFISFVVVSFDLIKLKGDKNVSGYQMTKETWKSS